MTYTHNDITQILYSYHYIKVRLQLTLFTQQKPPMAPISKLDPAQNPSGQLPQTTDRKTDQACVQLPSESVQTASTRSDTPPQQAATQPGSGSELPSQNLPAPHFVEIPAEPAKPVSFRDQVIGVAKKTRGTLLHNPDLVEEGEMILEGHPKVHSEEPSSV